MRIWGGAVVHGVALLVPRIVTATPQHPDSIRFTVGAPASVRRGEPVPIMLRITNAGDRPLHLYLTGRSITFDIIVAKSDGQVVWRRLEHLTSQQILQVKTLAPGESMELKDVWKQGVAEGEYTVQGVLPTDGAPLRTAPTRLRIRP
jgi:hypothetical protein